LTEQPKPLGKLNLHYTSYNAMLYQSMKRV